MARFKHIERVDEITKLECENQECSSCQFRDNYSTCMERYTNNLIYDTAYQDAAREIFEEIENFITNEYLTAKDSRDIEGYVKSSVHYGIAELKKKYTEGNDNGCT